MQLAYEPVVERKITKGELGHLKKAGATAHRHLAEFRGDTELSVGDTVTVESFQPGDAIKVAGTSIGKGFAGTIKRHNFKRGPVSHGSHNIRKPGSIGASATPSRVFRGQKMSGRMGGERVTQLGLVVHQVDVERNLLLVRGLGPGPEERHRRDQEHRLMAASKSSASKVEVLGGAAAKDATLAAAVFGAELKRHIVHEVVRAELNAHRAATRGAKTRGLVSGGRAKPWRQKGTGRARQGTIRAPHFTGGGVAFAPGMRNFEVKVNRKVRRAALAGALSNHVGNETLALVDGSAFDTPSTKQAKALVESWGKQTPLVVVAHEDEIGLIKSFRNLDRVLVTVASELEVAPIVWARSVLVSEAALPLVEGKAT